MVKMSKKGRAFALAASLAAFTFVGCGQPSAELAPEERVAEINWVIQKFEHNYAPLDYKQKLHNFNWEERKAYYREQAGKEDTNNQKLYLLIQQLVGEFRDAHTGVLAMWDGLPGKVQMTYLGFTGERVKENNVDKFYVQKFLPSFKAGEMNFPVKVGDKITKVDDKEIYQFVSELCPRRLGQEESDRSNLIPLLALITTLECRLPENPTAKLTIERAGETLNVSIPWVKHDYFEAVKEQRLAQADLPAETPAAKKECAKFGPNGKKANVTAGGLVSDNLATYMENLKNRIAMSTARSLRSQYFVSLISAEMLARPMFDAPKKDGAVTKPEDCVDGTDGFPIANDDFVFKVFAKEKGNVGYVKLAAFDGGDAQVETFKKGLADLKKFNVKAIVVDMADNGGGSLDYGLKLAALLKGQTRSEPQMEVRLNDNWVNGFLSEAVFGSTEAHRAMAQQHYDKFKGEQAAGSKLSSRFSYTKAFSFIPEPTTFNQTKVVLMVNEMCASMCDIFTADLKDNGVAKIIGKKTMGAGGNVTQHGISPRLALMISQTESLIVRANGEYIENKGVDPDKVYEPNSLEREQNYPSFINAAVDYALAE